MKSATTSVSGGRKLPILIIDKQGFFGEKLAALTSLETVTILVSKQEYPARPNVVSIPFSSRVPKIPDNTFSHIFIFFQGENDVLPLLHPLSKKAKEANAKLFFITPRIYATHEFLEKLKDIHSQIRLLIFSDVFGSDEIATPVQRFIQQVKTDGTLTLYNNGLTKRYPIYLADLLQAVLREADAEHGGKTRLLSSPHPVTDLSIARLLSKIDPAIQMRLHEKSHERENHALHAASAVDADYPLQDRLAKALSLPPSVNRRDKKPSASSEAPSLRKYASILLILLFFLVLLPLATTVLPGSIGFLSLFAAERAFSSGQLGDAKTYATIAGQSFAIAKTGSEAPASIAPYIGLDGMLQEGVLLVETGSSLSQILKDALSAQEYIQKGLDGGEGGAKTDFLTGVSLAKNTALQLQQLTLTDSIPKSIQKKILTFQKPVALFANVADSLPVLLGFEKERTYMLLFQNNMELRPGGGFIGSYGILRVKNGNVEAFGIHDVYDADGQLKGHIDPPFGLRRYLGVGHWFLRDSNFSPVFAKNASLAAQLLHLETGERVDGVIALDTSVLSQLLRITGPVYVPDFQERVDADNFFLTTQKHVESNFTPGSSQKKDFLRAFYNSLLLKLSENPIAFADAVTLIYESVRTKHAMIAVSDVKTQQVLSANEVSGTFSKETTNNDTFVDFLSVSEANVGANKVNYYIQRKIHHTVSLSEEGEYTGIVSLQYENTSTTSSPFGGIYKNYLRVFVPSYMELIGVSLDGQEQQIVPAITEHQTYSQSTFTPPAGVEIEKIQEEGNVGYGLFVQVPPLGKKTVDLLLKSSRKIAPDSHAFSYRYTLHKQPGTDRDAFSYIFNLPASLQVTAHAGGAGVIGGKQIVASGELLEDVSFSFTASEK